MALIDISIFKGEIPRLSAKKLPDGYAVQAVNCDFSSGGLRPAPGVSFVEEIGDSVRSIFKLAGSWLKWAAIVSVVRSLIYNSGGRILVSDDGYPKETNEALALAATPYPYTTRRLGIPAPTNALTIVLNGTAGSDVIRSCSYVYTIVGAWEDGSAVESAPSHPTGNFDIHDGITPSLTGFTNSTAAGVFTTHFRIYRLNSGTSGASFQYVDEIPIGSTQYDDTVPDDSLGEVLPTADPNDSLMWDAPIDELSGLKSTANGLVFGFYKNRVYPSAVFTEYAFPSKYLIPTESDVVGFGTIDNTVFAFTKTRPYMIYGNDPAILSSKPLSFFQACVSARSIVGVPGGVIVATPDGLYLFDSNGNPTNLTSHLYTPKQWKALNPGLIFAFYYNEKYLAFFSGTKTGLEIDFSENELKHYSLPQKVYGGYYDPEDDTLYLIQARDPEVTREIVSWETGADLSYTWSKLFAFSQKQRLAAYRLDGDFSLGSVTMKLKENGVEIYSTAVTSDEPARFPKGVSMRNILVELSGTAGIDRVVIGQSMEEVLNG